MFSIRNGLDKKRQEVVQKLCQDKLEILFARFNNILRYRYGAIELLSKREMILLATQINSEEISVSIISKTQSEELIEVSTTFPNDIKIDKIKSILKYLLDREDFVYQVDETDNAIKLTFEI